MIFHKVHTRRFLNETPDGSDSGSAGESQTSELEALKSQIAALDKKNKELLGEKKTLKSEFETLKGQFSGVDIEAVKSLLQRASQDEETRLLAEGKFDDVFNKRTEKLKQDLEKKLTAAEQEKQTLAQRAKAFESKVLDNAVLQAAAKVGLHQHAIDDALFRGRAMFRLDENGDAVAVDANGNVLMGKDGKSPYTPAEWLEDMKEKAPHWFPAPASGSGAQGGGFGGNRRQGNIGGTKEERVAAIKNKFPGLHG